MHRLFWGLFFVLLDVEITVGRASFEILPDFVGFFLLMKGMEGLSGEIPRFEKNRHVAFGLVLAGAVGYGAGLLNLDSMGKVWLWVLDAGCVAGFLWLLKQITADMGQELKSLGRTVGVVLILRQLLEWVPLIGKVCAVAAGVIGAVFLAALWKEIRRSAE